MALNLFILKLHLHDHCLITVHLLVDVVMCSCYESLPSMYTDTAVLVLSKRVACAILAVVNSPMLPTATTVAKCPLHHNSSFCKVPTTHLQDNTHAYTAAHFVDDVADDVN